MTTFFRALLKNVVITLRRKRCIAMTVVVVVAAVDYKYKQYNNIDKKRETHFRDF